MSQLPLTPAPPPAQDSRPRGRTLHEPALHGLARVAPWSPRTPPRQERSARWQAHPQALGRGDAARGSRLAGCPAHSSGGVTPSAAARAADWLREAPYGGSHRHSREPPHLGLEPRERLSRSKRFGSRVRFGQATSITPLHAPGARITDVDRPWSGPEPTLPALQEQHPSPPHLPSRGLRPGATLLGHADFPAANLQGDFGLVKGAESALARSPFPCCEGRAEGGLPYPPAGASHYPRKPYTAGLGEDDPYPGDVEVVTLPSSARVLELAVQTARLEHSTHLGGCVPNGEPVLPCAAIYLGERNGDAATAGTQLHPAHLVGATGFEPATARPPADIQSSAPTVNSDMSDNRLANLRPLCRDCHHAATFAGI